MREAKMTKKILVALCLLAMPLAAAAATYTATLSGIEGASGFAVVDINGDTIDYSILVSGFSATSAILTDGTVQIDLEPAFVAGSAQGMVSSGNAAAVEADPASFEVQVGDGAATLTGVLTAGDAAESVIVFPVAVAAPGLGGSTWLTDVRLVNLTAGDASVTFEYYPEGAAGNTAPGATAMTTVAAGTEAVLDDMVFNQFGIDNGKGAVIVRSDRELIGYARIYNDQTGAGLGTFGQLAKGLEIAEGFSAGVIAFLSNQDQSSGTGYRTNMGWFNPNATPVTVTMTGWDAATGAQLGQVTLNVAGLAQQQVAVSSSTLWPALNPYDDFIVTYEVNGDANLFVYGSVVDNVNGDAIYVPAAPIN
jgi:hypothetical protein